MQEGERKRSTVLLAPDEKTAKRSDMAGILEFLLLESQLEKAGKNGSNSQDGDCLRLNSRVTFT
jgi:hypothetical protein